MAGRIAEGAEDHAETVARGHLSNEAVNEDGVDLTLIWSALEMTPLERLERCDLLAGQIERIRALNGIKGLAT
jgi:hypothetical protein